MLDQRAPENLAEAIRAVRQAAHTDEVA